MDVNSASGSSSSFMAQNNSRMVRNEFPPAAQKVSAEKVKENGGQEKNNSDDSARLNSAFLPENFSSFAVRCGGEKIYGTLVGKLREVRPREKLPLHNGEEELVISKREETLPQLIQGIDLFASDKQRSDVLDMLEDNQNEISSKDMEEILTQLVCKITCFGSRSSSSNTETDISKMLQPRIFNVLEHQAKVIPPEKMCSILEELIPSIGAFHSIELKFRVLDMLENKKKVMPADKMKEMLQKLMPYIIENLELENRRVTLEELEKLKHRVLTMLKNNQDVISNSEVMAFLEKLVPQTSCLSTSDDDALWCKVLVVIPSGEVMGFVENLQKKRLWISQELWIKVLDVIPHSEVMGFVKKLQEKGLWISQELWTKVLDVIPSSEVLELVEKLMQKEPFTEALRLLALDALKKGQDAISQSKMGEIVEQLNGWHRAMQLSNSYCADSPRSSTSQEDVDCKQVVDGHASTAIDANTSTGINVNASPTIDSNNLNTPTTASANTSFFRKALLRVSTIFQNAWKWFLEHIPSAFRVHLS